jgi:hypothetical protein
LYARGFDFYIGMKMPTFNVQFRYYSVYEDETENYDVTVEETIHSADSLDILLRIIGVIEDEEYFDMDFDDSEGINYDASSEMEESGREALRIEDEKGDVVWSKPVP